MTYIITYENKFDEDYVGNNKVGYRCDHRTLDEYVVKSLDQCKDVLRNILDVPEKELTDQEIKDDFGSIQYPIDDAKLATIKEYYNGRLALHNKAVEAVESYTSYFEDIKNGVKDGANDVALVYDIPEKYNSFIVADDFDAGFKQLYATLTIKIMID